jgi:hypothetical protein
LPSGEGGYFADRYEKGGPHHIVFLHLETVHPVSQNQSSGR